MARSLLISILTVIALSVSAVHALPYNYIQNRTPRVPIRNFIARDSLGRRYQRRNDNITQTEMVRGVNIGGVS